ncbi:hypothetical protein A3K73_03010 [Candidatus Pacearchaeota archaeon RBG_13_36_9]|nr:MAG: hypothetical protein A3K73_03010 [Candidatus Pacearchaeota archaeon RBG_13_36_9]
MKGQNNNSADEGRTDWRKLKSLILLVGALFAGQTKAQERPFYQGASLDTRIASQYLAGKAGFIIEDEPVMQNCLNIDTKAGSFYAWSNTIIDSKDTSEVDLGWISPAATSAHFGANLTVGTYTYPNSEKNWKEWDLEAGVNFFARGLPLNANLYVATSLTANGDSSNLVKLTAGKSFDLGKFKTGLEGSVVYSDKYYSKDKGFSHATIRAELAREITKGPELYVYGIVQEELGRFEKVEDSVMGGAGVRYKF